MGPVPSGMDSGALAQLLRRVRAAVRLRHNHQRLSAVGNAAQFPRRRHRWKQRHDICGFSRFSCARPLECGQMNGTVQLKGTNDSTETPVTPERGAVGNWMRTV